MKLRAHHWLALLPALGLFAGVPVLNRAEPHILGWPPLMAWMVAGVFLTAIVMGAIYLMDRGSDADE